MREFTGPNRMSQPFAVGLTRRGAWLVCMAAAMAPWAVRGAESQGQPVQFNRDIRPIISANCFFCHGPDPTHREADLRLDREEGVRQAFGGRDPGKSEAWRRMTSQDEDERMPPPSAHKVLKRDQFTLVKKWIEQGAPWQDHWAFVKPVVGGPWPVARGERKTSSAIDGLLLKTLQAQGLAMSPEADRERLLRRVTFDLTGLPPTIQEIDDFLADKSDNAFEKVVDRLLASPHYGERMALAWLDAARYGDSSVFHADGPRDMWPWRDWVIKAYNANMPFDQFTIEQLAGDLLPNPTVEQKIATGFNRNNASTDEGGVIPEEYRVEYVVDRVKTTSMVWLGLTMECGQCHDHKYDPISQREYYQFFAYFNQAADPGMQTRNGNQAPVANVPNYARLADVPRLNEKLAALEAKRAARLKDGEPEFQGWLSRAAAEPEQAIAAPAGCVLYAPLDEGSGDSVADASEAKHVGRVQGSPQWMEGKTKGAFQSGGQSHIDFGDSAGFDSRDAFSYGAWVKPTKEADGSILARMDEKKAHRGYDLFLARGKVAVHLVHRWPDNAIKVITKGSVVSAGGWQHVLATYDGSGKAAGVRIYVNGNQQPVVVEQNKLKGTIRTPTPLKVGRRSEGSTLDGLVDELRIYPRQLAEAEILRLADRDPIRPLLAVAAGQHPQKQLETLRMHFFGEVDAAYRDLATQIKQTSAELAETTKPVSTVMVMQDAPQRRMTYVLDRGSYDAPKKDQPVEPGVPTALPPLPKDAPANRLGLARWLTQPDHPLTARVAVNRFWQVLFGDGLVRTPEDFGSQGEPPTHPELLDYLAVDFVEHGWDVKRLIKEIVMSQAYRQTSRITPQLLAADPENRLLGRGPRFRLPGEFLRDNALAAAGLLNTQIGGPSVRVYQPEGLWEELAIDLRLSRFVQDRGDNLYRRGMYIYWKRSAPPPSMILFDAPSREKCALRRGRTNTPLQALVAMNDPQFVEAARVLARRAVQEGGATPAERIAYAFRLAAGVRPRSATLDILTRAFAEERAVFKQQPERAAKLLSVGETKRDPTIDEAEHAAMTIVMSMILNLDETLTRL